MHTTTYYAGPFDGGSVIATFTTAFAQTRKFLIERERVRVCSHVLKRILLRSYHSFFDGSFLDGDNKLLPSRKGTYSLRVFPRAVSSLPSIYVLPRVYRHLVSSRIIFPSPCVFVCLVDCYTNNGQWPLRACTSTWGILLVWTSFFV